MEPCKSYHRFTLDGRGTVNILVALYARDIRPSQHTTSNESRKDDKLLQGYVTRICCEMWGAMRDYSDGYRCKTRKLDIMII